MAPCHDNRKVRTTGKCACHKGVPVETLFSIMARRPTVLFPASERQMKAFGERLRLARLRRRYTAAMVAVRAGITRPTLRTIEKGAASVSFGSYVAVLNVLGLAGDLDALARDDELGRKLQDMQLKTPRRARSSR